MPETQTAEVLKQDGPTQDDAEVLTNANPEGGEVDPQANANETDAEGHKRLGGWQRKIKKLQEQNETLLEALRKVGGEPAKTKVESEPVEDKAPVKPIRPKSTDFSDWDKYEEALVKYETDRDEYHEKNLAYQLRQQETVKQKTNEQQQIADGWASQVAEARKTHADYDEVSFNEETPMSAPMMHAIVTSELGAEIAYELGKNPDEAERIAQLGSVAAIREIGKIEARIAGTKAATETDKEDKEEPPVATTRAPKPPSTVKRPVGTNNEPDDKDDYKTWERKRIAQINARKGV